MESSWKTSKSSAFISLQTSLNIKGFQLLLIKEGAKLPGVISYVNYCNLNLNRTSHDSYRGPGLSIHLKMELVFISSFNVFWGWWCQSAQHINWRRTDDRKTIRRHVLLPEKSTFCYVVLAWWICYTVKTQYPQQPMPWKSPLSLHLMNWTKCIAINYSLWLATFTTWAYKKRILEWQGRQRIWVIKMQTKFKSECIINGTWKYQY